MSAEKQLEEYVEESLELLEDDGFEVVENQRFQGSKFRAVGFKSQGYGTGTLELVFVFKKFNRLSADKLEEFADDAYSYANQTRKSSWPVGMNNLLWVYAVALAAEATDEVVEDVTDDKPKIQGFGFMVLPVIYDADEDDVYYFEGPGDFGSRGIKKVAKFVEKYLVLD